MAAFNPDRTAIEPKTPSSPCEPPVYPSSPSIPEEQLNCDLNENNEQQDIKEINQLSIPSPPPSPPTHVPLDYINIIPANIPNDLQIPTKDIIEKDNCSPPDTPKILNNELVKAQTSEETKILVDVVTDNSQEIHIQSDHVQDVLSTGFDVVDAPRLPDYMNIQLSDQEPRVVGTIPKKLPAPPVPPRGKYLYLFSITIFII